MQKNNDMTTPIQIRPAQLSDVSGILPLMEQLGYPTDLPSLEKRFQKFVSKEGHQVVVACQGTKIVGWIAWAQFQVFVVDKIGICIEGLVVGEPYRHQGIGKQLMGYMEEQVSKLGPCIIELTSGLHRAKDGTHDFYKALGYHNDGPMAKIYLRKEV